MRYGFPKACVCAHVSELELMLSCPGKECILCFPFFLQPLFSGVPPSRVISRVRVAGCAQGSFPCWARSTFHVPGIFVSFLPGCFCLCLCTEDMFLLSSRLSSGRLPVITSPTCVLNDYAYLLQTWAFYPLPTIAYTWPTASHDCSL